MPISVVCDECDHSFRVPDEAAGRRVRCKSCGSPVSVPDDEWDDADDEPPQRAPAPKKKARKRRGKRARPREMTQKVKEAVLGLAVGGLLNFVFSLIGWVNMRELDEIGWFFTYWFTGTAAAAIVCSILVANRVPGAHPLSVICAFLMLFTPPLGTITAIIILLALYADETKAYLGLR